MLQAWQGYAFDSSKYKPLTGIIPTDEEVLFASYGGGAYEGDAFVLFRKDGKLYEVHGSHCSCMGLENQWEPEETTFAALAAKQRKTPEHDYYYFLHDHDGADKDSWELIDSLTK